MTEEEAKTKWCPYVLNAGCNRNPVDGVRVLSGELKMLPGGAQCVASDCMMWRWEVNPEACDIFRNSTTKGCCGLAK